jgi:hypothetical protein
MTTTEIFYKGLGKKKLSKILSDFKYKLEVFIKEILNYETTI